MVPPFIILVFIYEFINTTFGYENSILNILFLSSITFK